MANGDSSVPEGIVLRMVRAPDPWNASFLGVSAFPIAKEELIRVKSFLRTFTASLLRGPGLWVRLFIQYNHLHREDGPIRFADHAREWSPKAGLGVWPDREPPTLWTNEDFENIPTKGMPRPLMYKVFSLSGSREVMEGGRDLMLGLGAVVQVVGDGPDTFLTRSTALLGPTIKERALRGFPFYMPLLEVKSLETVSADQLDEWLCGATVYIRESTEDRGILFLSRRPLEPLFRELGGSLAQATDLVWSFQS